LQQINLHDFRVRAPMHFMMAMESISVASERPWPWAERAHNERDEADQAQNVVARLQPRRIGCLAESAISESGKILQGSHSSILGPPGISRNR
jgi:hypothetical protein